MTNPANDPIPDTDWQLAEHERTEPANIIAGLYITIDELQDENERLLFANRAASDWVGMAMEDVKELRKALLEAINLLEQWKLADIEVGEGMPLQDTNEFLPRRKVLFIFERPAPPATS